ncbi:peptidase M17 [Mucilaginibacter pallidiroseus]|uniref:Peptidase M17 n=1 Tax=Mucilaginibacter pallidiroseus TaxID=2599295 RepID=A0A563UE51_9SPHI|nr:M17 family peptidase N-terminal domain-containing protein [Mucilaginibacter pallidiroseus]TWR29631.1 peptidase M17 [Mucilaginibacter pallidiroseus]
MKNIKKLLLSIVAIITISLNVYSQNASEKLTPINTYNVLGNASGLTIAAKVQSPSAQATPLQIICVFEYTEGDIFNSPPALPRNLNGMVHVDEALKGLITDLRQSGKFAGHAFETLLITPADNSIPAKKLLLIGLGDRKNFNPDLMTEVGRIGMREALRLGVNSYSHASDLKDAGIDSPTGTVAVNVVKGALDAYETEKYLQSKAMAKAPTVKQVTLLAGPAFFTPSGDAVKNYLSTQK